MSKQRISFKKAFSQGLRPEKFDPPEEYLANCANLRPSRRGMIHGDGWSYPVTSGPSNPGTFPRPTMLKGTTRNLVIGDNSGDKLYKLASNWAATEITGITSTADGSTGVSLDFGTTRVQYAERNDVWFICWEGGYCTNAPLWGGVDTFVSTPASLQPWAEAVCIDDTGRLFLGNIGNSLYWGVSSFATSLWDIWRNAAPDYVLVQKEDVGPGVRSVIWGMPGGGDPNYPYTMLMAAMTGFVSPATPDITDVVKAAARDWKIGFAFAPWEGEIVCLKQLGNQIMVYGDQGIGFMQQMNDGGYIIKQIAELGSRSYMLTSAFNRHIFVDQEDNLWEVTPGPQLRRLGYGEFVAPLDNNMVVNYDDNEQAYYICDDTGGLVLNDYGMGKPYYCPWSVCAYGAYQYGSFYTMPDATNSVTIAQFDMDARTFKTIEFVELGIDTLTSVTVTVYGRTEKGSFVEIASVSGIDAATIVDVNQSGVDFYLEVEDTTWWANGIQYVNVVVRDDGKYGIGEYL